MSARHVMAAGVVAALLAGGCTPRYVVPPGAPSAKLQIVDGQAVSLCRGGNQYFASPARGESFAVIPADVQISVGRGMRFPVYGGSYNCHPQFTFVPVADATYVVDVGLMGDKCVAEVARLSPDKRTGLQGVKPMDTGSCSKKKKR